MAAITFDTLKFVEHLKHSGISEKSAKAISETFREAQLEMEITTRKDLREMEHRLNTKFITLEHRVIMKLSAVFTLLATLTALIQKLL